MKALKKTASILPWVLAVTAIIAAVIVFVYADRAQIDSATEAKVAELQESNAGLQSKADDLLTKVVTLKSKTVGLQIKVKSLQEELDEKYSNDDLRWDMYFTAENMKKLIVSMPSKNPNAIDIIAKNLFDQAAGRIGDLRCGGTESLPFSSPSVEAKIGHYTYSKCDMLYSDIVKIYSEIFTGEALDDCLGHMFADVDGWLYAVPGGGMTGIGIDNIELTRVSEKKNEIKYNVSFAHVFIQGSEYADSCSMTIKLVNGGWRISEIDYIEDYWKSSEEYWLTHDE